MKPNWNKILFWTPRILTILFILFISLFALDVFGEYSFPAVLLALFMHMIPSLILIALLLVSWRWELAGGALFVILGIGFIFFFDTYENIFSFLFISSPVILIGALFLLHWRLFRKINK